MTTFDRREEAFENRFFHDEELTFKAHARRNQKVGMWAAHQLGKDGREAEEYAQALIALEIEGGGDDAIVHKLLHDFRTNGVEKSEHQVRRQMDDLLAEARLEVRLA